jgi:hypothetical protein
VRHGRARLGQVGLGKARPGRVRRAVREELWQAAKARAEQKGETLTDVIMRVLKRYVKGGDMDYKYVLQIETDPETYLATCPVTIGCATVEEASTLAEEATRIARYRSHVIARIERPEDFPDIFAH